MIKAAIDRLDFLCNHIPDLLRSIDKESFDLKPGPDKWSKKEILGHLIDSATNNHQRFVRAQFEDNPRIGYDQDNWNLYSFHQQIDGQQLINFWALYNKQLLEIVKRIPNDSLLRQCAIGDKLFTLEFLIKDYVEHMEHHLKQVVSY